MTIEQAIKKAVEGGWKPGSAGGLVKFNDGHDRYLHVRSIFLNPEFWRSLFPEKDDEMRLQWVNNGVPVGDTHWLYQWHAFIDHLAGGKSAEEFFESFLN